MASVENSCFWAGKRLLLVGHSGTVHVGAHLSKAAAQLGLKQEFGDIMQAYQASPLVAKFNWWLRNKRPTRLRQFGQEVVRAAQEFRPHWILTTGLAPLEDKTLAELQSLGVKRLNFLTDDPWNPAHRTEWFMRALPQYDHVFSPRRANIGDLQALGCRRISYLPFAYAPDLHFPEPPQTPAESEKFTTDVAFAGGADADRVPYFAALTKAGFKVALYGGYWKNYAATKAYDCGMADPPTLRKVLGGAKVSLCLVRRANRDGHSMRTFEAPAIGACLLLEDTEEHRAIFGVEGQAAMYFRSIAEMVQKTAWLVAHEAERRRLATAAYSLITDGNHTYTSRLLDMLRKV